MLKIKEVEKNSFGEELGFEKGDRIIAFDGFETVDLLDYTYYDAQTQFKISALTKDGEEVTVEVDKYEDETLGLTFEDDGLKIKTCHNNCLFCFVKQMPCGMRESLYVKDDDYRQSFLCGNFITLTNVTDDDLQRIIRLKLSPLYVSVHAIDGEVRKKLLNNPFADKISWQLQKLCEGGIDVHAQIVLVKGINDGKELDFTIDELYKLSNVKTVAVVPCGITKFRENLFPIEDIDQEYALSVINQVEKANLRNGGNLVQLADEFYFKSKTALPSFESYGDFWQIENGIGMSAKFKNDVEFILENSEKQVLKKGKYLTFSGTSVFEFMREIVKDVENSCEGVSIDLVAIENNFFGLTVNCTGLLTGEDVLNALLPFKGKYDELLVPNNCLMQFEDVFLDGTTLKELEEKLEMKVKRVAITS